MNILLKKPITKIEVDEKTYEIETDFRSWIEFEILLSNPAITENTKAKKCISFFLSQIPQNLNEAITKLMFFYNGNEQSKSSTNKPDKKNNQMPIYSFEQDQHMIYVDFMHYYHIDLSEIEYLHWWKFRQLFFELPDEAKVKKVMLYRSIKIDSKLTKEQKNFYMRMKRIYALEDKRSDSQKANTFANVLNAGMHIKNG